LRRAAMPTSVRIEEQVLGNELNVVRTETLQRFSVGAGSTALLTRLAALWLAITLRNHPQCPLLFRMSASADPIAHALQLIDADIACDWSVERMARKVGMSRSSFAARFTAEAGQTPMELLTEKRMHAAADLLQHSRIKIAEISARVGYQSEAAFSRRFARFFGMAPGQMRHGTSHTANRIEA
jgi:transcriptional regulator GlxA family with amidase domain